MINLHCPCYIIDCNGFFRAETYNQIKISRRPLLNGFLDFCLIFFFHVKTPLGFNDKFSDKGVQGRTKSGLFMSKQGRLNKFLDIGKARWAKSMAPWELDKLHIHSAAFEE
jgi:hypothetical protein